MAVVVFGARSLRYLSGPYRRHQGRPRFVSARRLGGPRAGAAASEPLRQVAGLQGCRDEKPAQPGAQKELQQSAAQIDITQVHLKRAVAGLDAALAQLAEASTRGTDWSGADALPKVERVEWVFRSIVTGHSGLS